MIKFNVTKLPTKKKNAISIFLKRLGVECWNDGIEISCIESKTEIKYIFDGEQLYLYGNQDVHFYRALHLFLQKYEKSRNGKSERTEKISFNNVGIMLDCSRNGTISIPTIKEFILQSAASGINQLFLYMEDVYEIPEDPYFGAFRGKYTYGELKDVDTFGCDVGVEIIPAIQTLALVLRDKSMLGINLCNAYKTNEKTELNALITKMEQLITTLTELKDKREEIWYFECRPFGYEILDIRLGGIIVRLQTAIKRLHQYIIGALEEIPELKEERLIFSVDDTNKEHTLCIGGFWQHMISAGNIAGI